MSEKRINALYACIMVFYFMSMALICSYASAYLLDRGFSNSQIGLLLGISSFLTIILQQAAAAFVSKTGFSLGNLVAISFIVLAVAAALLLLFPLEGPLFAVTFGAVHVILNTMQPSVNSLYLGYEQQGYKINYAVCRGFGSATFSLTALIAGQLLLHLNIRILPVLYLVPAVIFSILVSLFRAPNIQPENEEAGKINLFREYPHFTMFLIGIVMIATAHTFVETYLLQILQRIGGDVGNLGIAVAIASITELPAMILYRRMYKKFGNRHLLMFAGWMWCLKCVLLLAAPNVYTVYGAELLQFFSYAIYVPAAAKHINHALPKSEILHGQALAGSALTAGGLISTIVGGRLIDIIGMRPTLFIIQLISIAGVSVFTVSIFNSLKKIPAKRRK